MTFKPNTYICILTVICSLFLNGCASKYGAQTTDVSYYPACYRPINDLRIDERNVDDSTMTGAAVGALLGALIGGLSTGKTEGAVVGAAAGGAVGAVGGHAYGTSEAKKRDREFFARYAGQLDAETAQMSRANAAAKIAAKCYDREFKRAVNDARAGKISKIELTNRYDEIRAGLEETSRILRVTSNNMHEKDAQYKQIMAEETNVYDPVYASEKPTRKPQATPKKQNQEVQKAATSTKKWQATKKDLDSTKQDLDAQIQNNDRILEAALNG